MRKYEVMFILDPQEEGEKNISQIKELFNEHEVNILSEKDLGLKRMSYPIKKKDRGHYFLFDVEMEVDTMNKLRRDLNFKEYIFRYMFSILGN